MADRPDKKRRKEIVAAWRAQKRAAAKMALPMSDENMKAMFDMLDVEFPQKACDHSLRLTRAWLSDNGLPVEKVVEWLNSNGGFCDCEALANSEEAFLWAAGREDEWGDRPRL